MKAYIGSYTQDLMTGKETGSSGIYLCDFNDDDGSLKIQESYAMSKNPSFLSLSADGKLLLAVNEQLGECALDTYEIRDDGTLSHLDRACFPGTACCYAELSPDCRYAMAVNYGEGELFVYRLDAGRFVERTDSVFNKGRGPVTDRQEGPHAHSVRRIEGKDRVVCCDLGCDRISFYQLDPFGKLHRDDGLTISAPPGRGPRHSAFSCGGNNLYISCELSNSVLYYRWDQEKYTLAQEISTLPMDFTGVNTAADIHIGPSGSYLYVSNRGHDSIACFSIDKEGYLRQAGYASCGGNVPRHFSVTEKHLLCSNQGSGSVTVLRLDKSGKLKEKVGEIRVPAAACAVISNRV